MDERSLLLAKVDALREQLDWAESSLKSAKINPRVSQAASIGFKRLFDRRRKELTRLRKSFSKTERVFSTELQRSTNSCAELFNECLGFLGGAMLRDAHKEDDICEIADFLLEDLSRQAGIRWDGVTLLAEAHFFTETTGLIRLPFPDYGIWNLPVAAHELGHFIGPRIPDGTGDFPFQALLQGTVKNYESGQLSEEEMVRKISHLRELFSDLFAVYALGPAYACSCIVLRFDPHDAMACEDGDTHPSYAKRVSFILGALERIAGNPYRKIIDCLRGLWEKNLKSAGHQTCLNEKSIPPLKYQLSELNLILTKFISTVQYLGWNRALELSDKFPLRGGVTSVLNDGDAIADVLNAVWVWRLLQKNQNINVVHRVNLEAIVLCRQIMQRQMA